jgi:hypothetical protein
MIFNRMNPLRRKHFASIESSVCLGLADRSFAALAIAADNTRFFTPTTLRSADPPNAFAAARTLLNG